MRAARALAGLVVGAAVLGAGAARAETRPDHVVELEPHLTVGPVAPPGDNDGTGLGAGLRLTFPILRGGFSPGLDDTLSVSAGADWLYYDDDDVVIGPCSDFVDAPNGRPICTAVGERRGDAHYFFVPIAAQWSLRFEPPVSLFVEAGLAAYFQTQERDALDVGATPVVAVGGRYYFAETMAVTLRLGYPTLSAGASFFF